MRLIFYNGIYTPHSMPFDLFVLLEILTIIIEGGILLSWNNGKPKDKSWSFIEIVFLVFLMNVVSSLLGLMFYLPI